MIFPVIYGVMLVCPVCDCGHFGAHQPMACDGDPFGPEPDDTKALPDRTELARRKRVALRPWLN